MQQDELQKTAQLQVDLLKAILVFLVDLRDQPDEPTKNEVLLSSAGLSTKEIASMLGKKEDTVRKVIKRAKGAS